MLKVENVSLFYGAAQALRGMSLSATIGKVTCLLGRNGVGKTSLLRAICGLQPIASGSIALDGKDVSKLPAYERARLGVAIVPQGREIFSLLTVKENLETGFAPVKREHRKVPDEVFELFPVLQSMLRRRGGAASTAAPGRARTPHPAPSCAHASPARSRSRGFPSPSAARRSRGLAARSRRPAARARRPAASTHPCRRARSSPRRSAAGRKWRAAGWS